MTFTFQDEEHVRRIVREEVEEQLTDFRSGVYNKLDKIIGMMEKRDQEVDLLAHRSIKHTDQLEDHESRLQSLEASTVSA